MQLNLQSAAQRLRAHLPLLITILFAIQPLMDILSYWMDRLEYSNTLTLLLRFAVLLAVVLAGFCLSRRKWVYYIAVGVIAALLIGHCACCFYVGYVDFVGDVTNFVRVAQMPLFALCLITFLRENENSASAVENGLILNFWIIALSVLLSVITGTAEYTYTSTTADGIISLGILGWFATGSAQVAVVSVLSPLAVILTYHKKKFWLFALTTAAAFVQLYFLATRLAFFTIVALTVGLLLVALLSRKIQLKYLAVLVVCAGMCFAFINQSPMMQRLQLQSGAASSKQSDADVMLDREEQQALEDLLAERAEDDESSELTEEEQEQARYEALKYIYEFYLSTLCERFGTDQVIQVYGGTTDLSTIINWRGQKIAFCTLLMNEHPLASRIFGVELARMTYNERVYDVENDFHGVYFLYGWAGLAAMLLFLAYFVFLIIKALIQSFKTYFTVEAGAVGVALCVSLLYAYNTCGVLRRPNSSFYLSVILAMVYYLVKLRQYPKSQPDGSLESGEEAQRQ